jgi:hypothetical protein
MTDELPAIDCESKGTMRFHFYAENVFTQFEISELKAYIIEKTGNTHDISDMVSCSPLSNLIGNQQITCSIDIQSLLINLPDCPLRGGIENDLKISVKITGQQGTITLIGMRKLILTRAGVSPSLSVVNIPDPKLNCIVGSEVDAILKINHAEILGTPRWSFVVNQKTRYDSEYIKDQQYFPEERIDTYQCALQVSNSTLPSCTGQARIDVYAVSNKKNITTDFNLTIVKQEFAFGMEVYPPGDIECQIVDKEGTCVPKDPQQTFDVLLTGSSPDKVKIYGFRYKLGDEDFSDTICKKQDGNRYSCLMFVTMDKSGSSGTRDLEVQADTKYLTSFSTLSAKSSVSTKGTLIDESINRTEAINAKKESLAYYKKIIDIINTITTFINTIQDCCALADFSSTLVLGLRYVSFNAIKDAFIKLLKAELANLWNKNEQWYVNLLDLILQNGPLVVSCLTDVAMRKFDAEMKNFQDFESGSLQNELETPDMYDLSNFVDAKFWQCIAANKWNSKKWSLVCSLAVGIIAVFVPGGAVAIFNICSALRSSVFMYVKGALTIVISTMLFIVAFNTYKDSKDAIQYARESLNAQLKAQEALESYSESFRNTVESISASKANKVLDEMFPESPEVKLVFTDQTGNLIGFNQSVCKNDLLTVEYEFGKFNVTGNFEPKLEITAPSGTKTLVFNNLSGSYGPITVKDLFNIANPPSPPTPSGDCNFALPGGDILYTIYYESTC